MRALVALGAVLVLAGGALAVGKNARIAAAAAAGRGHLRLPASERRLGAPRLVPRAPAARGGRRCPGMSEDAGRPGRRAARPKATRARG